MGTLASVVRGRTVACSAPPRRPLATRTKRRRDPAPQATLRWVLPRVPCVDYRHHLRAVVAASAAPYGYTLTLWTAGAVTSHAQGLPSALDALLLLAGAVTGFAAVGAVADGGLHGGAVAP